MSFNSELLKGVHQPGLKNKKAYKERFASEQSRIEFDQTERLVLADLHR